MLLKKVVAYTLGIMVIVSLYLLLERITWWRGGRCCTGCGLQLRRGAVSTDTGRVPEVRL